MALVEGGRGAPVPRQEFVDLVHRMPIGHALKDILEIGEGLALLSLAVVMSEQTVAQRSAPPSDPANRWFLRPSVTGRIARSTVLLSRSMRPSRKQQRMSQRLKV